MAKQPKKRNKKYNPLKTDTHNARLLSYGFYAGGAAYPLRDEQNNVLPLNSIVYMDVYQGSNLDEIDKSRHEFCYIYPRPDLERAIFAYSHRWTLGVAVVNRDSRGKVYLSQVYDIPFKAEYRYIDAMTVIQEQLFRIWKLANPKYRLTIAFCLSTHEREFDVECYLQQLFYRSTLSKLCTKYEHDNNKQVEVYQANSFNDFLMWYNNQKGKNAVKPNLTLNPQDLGILWVDDGNPDVKETAKITLINVTTKLIPKLAMTDIAKMQYDKAGAVYGLEVRTQDDLNQLYEKGL